MQKWVNVKIDVASEDLRAFKARADAEGVPYKTLIVSIVNKYVRGEEIA